MPLFESLQALGPEKFTKILNGLMRGQSAMGLAREIQSDWGDFSGVAERTLTQQLNRLRLKAAKGVFGAKIAAGIQKGQTPQFKILAGVCPSSIERLEELAGLQRQRVLTIVAYEAAHRTAKTIVLPTQAINMVFTDYAKMLIDLQKIRFELGLDEYKGVVPGLKGTMASVTLPDGTNVQKAVFEAVTTLEGIFERRQVPQPKASDVAGL